MTKTIALYIRLSREDLDLNYKKRESDSVTNQRSMIVNYITSNIEFKNCKKIEYIDDGYSGKDFERPAFNKMIEDAKKGCIDCIIVKDISRLGRNYLGVGNFIENIFPFLGIRFISIIDNYDSKTSKNMNNNFSLNIKNLSHEYHIRNLSKKIKDSLRISAENGWYSAPKAFYGYNKSEKDKHKLEINAETSEVVKWIFNMKANGHRSAEIAKILNEKNIATPKEYLKTKNIKHSCEYNEFWTNYIVKHIIKNEIYIGKNVRNKFSTDFKGKIHSVPYDKRIIRNTQPAVVSEEIFNMANSNKKGNVNNFSSKQSINNIFSKKIICNGCKHFLTRRGDKYLCHYSNISNLKCYKGRLDKIFLSSLIIDNINTMSNIAQNIKNILESNVDRNKKNMLEEINKTKKIIKSYKSKKLQIFESFSNNEISEQDYILKSKDIEDTIEKTEDTLFQLENQKNKSNKFIEEFSKYNNIKELTKDIVENLIEKIIVHYDGSIEIVWRFKDSYKEALEYYDHKNN